MTNINDLLFEYIKNMVYNPEKANLDIDSLPEDYKKLAKGIKQICEWGVQANIFTQSIAHGELDPDIVPSAENPFASGAKTLQSTLKHLTWQTAQIAKGDYSQRMHYLGKLSHSFNEMVKRLELQKTGIQNENNILVKFFDRSNDSLAVFDYSTGAMLYSNKIVQANVFSSDYPPGYGVNLNTDSGCAPDHQYSEWIHIHKSHNNSQMYFKVHSVFTFWDNKPAIAHWFANITSDIVNNSKLHDLAMHDYLTGLYNRRYAVEYLLGCVAAEEDFCFAYIDIDYLKYCNDEFGHIAGDKYILEIIEILKGVTENGVVCRLGGDEFAIICEKNEKELLVNNLNNEQKKICKKKINGNGKHYKNFSFGIIEHSPGDDPDVIKLLQSADELMYANKLEHKKKKKNI